MNITAESYGHAVALNLKGELTEDTLPIFDKAVDHQLADEQVVDVLLNLEEVTFIDSLMLERLLDLQDKLAERLGQVRLVKPDENVHKILEITRLTKVFEMYDNLTDAVKVVRA